MWTFQIIMDSDSPRALLYALSGFRRRRIVARQSSSSFGAIGTLSSSIPICRVSNTGPTGRCCTYRNCPRVAFVDRYGSGRMLWILDCDRAAVDLDPQVSLDLHHDSMSSHEIQHAHDWSHGRHAVKDEIGSRATPSWRTAISDSMFQERHPLVLHPISALCYVSTFHSDCLRLCRTFPSIDNLWRSDLVHPSSSGRFASPSSSRNRAVSHRDDIPDNGGETSHRMRFCRDDVHNKLFFTDLGSKNETNAIAILC